MSSDDSFSLDSLPHPLVEEVMEESNESGIDCKETGKDGEFVCGECGKVFYHKRYLKSHSVVHSGERKYSCVECGRYFTQKSSLNTHLARHRGEPRFRCNSCGKGFFQKSGLKTHMLIHDTERVTFDCDECERQFLTEDGLQNHMLSHGQEGKLKCDECGKHFNKACLLKKHQLITHSKEKNFVCLWPNCGKKFTFENYLRSHLLIHSEEKKYQCNICGKKFKRFLNLSLHKNVHKDKIYECPECDKKFSTKSSLKGHREVHSDIRYNCPKCDKSFTNKQNLKTHSNVHTVKKEYKCDQCGKRYYFISSFKHHMKTHDNSCSFECLDCRFIYSCQTSCRSHMLTKHKEESIQTQQFQCTKCLKSITSNCTTKINLDNERTICLDCYEPPKKMKPSQVVSPSTAPANNWSLVLLGYQIQNGNLIPFYAAIDAAGNAKPTEGSNDTLSKGGDSIIKSPEESKVTVSEEGSNATLPGGSIISKPNERRVIPIPLQEGGDELLSKEETVNKTQQSEPIIQEVGGDKVVVKQEVEKTFNVEQVFVQNFGNLDVKQEIKEEIITDY